MNVSQTSADPEDPDFGLWTPGSQAWSGSPPNTTIWYVAALCFIVDVWTDRRTFLLGWLGHLSGDDVKKDRERKRAGDNGPRLWVRTAVPMTRCVPCHIQPSVSTLPTPGETASVMIQPRPDKLY